jgi:hypothetical protein
VKAACFVLPGPAFQPIIERVPELNCSHDAFLPMWRNGRSPRSSKYTSSVHCQDALAPYAHPKLTDDAKILFAAAGEEVGHAHRL